MNDDYISFNVLLSKEDIINELGNYYSDDDIENMDLEDEGKTLLEGALQERFSNFFVTND
jgi:hypothetical protein